MQESLHKGRHVLSQRTQFLHTLFYYQFSGSHREAHTSHLFSIMGEENYFKYIPNETLIYVAAGCFAASSLYYSVQVFRFRAWYFIPFLIGCISEAVGYGARRYSAEHVDKIGPYIGQGLLLLLPPAFFSATVYMILKKIIICMDAQEYSKLSTKWLTKIFVAADVFSLFLQAAGGGLQGAKKKNLTSIGQGTTIFGLGVQVVAFTVFLWLTWHFASAMLKDYNSPAYTCAEKGQERSWRAPWRQCIYAIYVSGGLILLRSIYRIVEYAMGHEGYLMVHEAYFYALDTLPMFLTTVVFIVVFPPALLKRQIELSIVNSNSARTLAV